MNILGISADYHDAAAALLVDGEIAAAAEQERFSRHKHDSSMPHDAVASCLAVGGISADDVDVVVFHEKPLMVMSRVLAARQRRGPAALGTFAQEAPTLVRKNLMVEHRIGSMLLGLGATRPPLVRYCEHHLSHASAAFWPSPFERAAVLTIDGIGEWATASVGRAGPRHVDLLEELRFPHSLGLLYSLATLWCGFSPNDGEYKLMGLAPYGEPSFLAELRRLVHVADDGAIDVDGRAVRWWSGDVRRRRSLQRLLGGPPRAAGEPITRREQDLARSVQELTEEVVLRMAAHAHRTTGERALCMSGGVALNCVANGRLLREGPFDDVWVQPAASDSGSALGAALWWWHDQQGNPPPRPAVAGVDRMRGAALGPAFSSGEVVAWLRSAGVDHRVVAATEERCALVADRLADGAIVGWFEGPMEFGPRALGRRSILADPRSPTVQLDLNRRVKGREEFRPFAPAVQWERAPEWFELDRPSPYMLFTFDVLGAGDPDAVPACTHVDGSARVQTVHRELTPAFHELLRAFDERTGCPVLLNTSFNVAGEPIVCTPEDALRVATDAGLDLLVLEDVLVELPHAGETGETTS